MGWDVTVWDPDLPVHYTEFDRRQPARGGLTLVPPAGRSLQILVQGPVREGLQDEPTLESVVNL